MKALRCLTVFLSIAIIMMLQACGGGGGGSDTNGVLTLSVPTVTAGAKIGDISSVSYTVTYTPPAGKVPNGVIIQQKILDSSGAVVFGPTDFQLYSNTSFNTGFPVNATAAQQLFSIDLSIGSMTAGTSVIIPAGI